MTKQEMHTQFNPSGVIVIANAIDSVMKEYERRTCSNCIHHTEATEHYGNCTRNGQPNPIEYDWFCAGYEKDNK